MRGSLLSQTDESKGVVKIEGKKQETRETDDAHDRLSKRNYAA